MNYELTEFDQSILKKIISTPQTGDFLKATYEFSKLMTYYQCAIMEVETKFHVLNEETNLRFDRQPISSIQSRIKDFTSLIKKMLKKGLPLSIENIEAHIHDVAGVRVICSFVDDVYALAQALERQDDIEILEVKDYIKNPKENGYRSLHLIVSIPIFLEKEKRSMKVEVQLRTIAMDSWASLEHQLRYKKNNTFDEKMSKDLKHCADISAELDKKMNQLKQQVDVEREDVDMVEYLKQEFFG